MSDKLGIIVTLGKAAARLPATTTYSDNIVSPDTELKIIITLKITLLGVAVALPNLQLSFTSNFPTAEY